MACSSNRAVRVREALCLAAIVVLLLCVPAIAQQADWSTTVLKEKDTDKKEFIVCKSGNKGVSAETLAKLATRERHGPAVASAAGQYFERAKLDKNTPGLLRLLAQRPDIGAQCVAYAALSPSAMQLINGFAGSGKDVDQRIAAQMLAATAVMRTKRDRQSKKPLDRFKGQSTTLDVNYKDQLATLLNNSEDELALEYALLAVAYDRAATAKEAAAKHTKNREEAVAMAAQFALASVKGEVDKEALLRTIKRRPKKARARPALSYDPRDTPRQYAIHAAGEARLAEAVELLIPLVGDEDLHTAVAAARALGKIGGEGIAVRLLGLTKDETPWPVRVALYDAAGFNPDKAAVKPLLDRFYAEEGRFRQDALYALLSIAAGKPEAQTIDAFRNWWNEHGEAFAVDVKATRAWRNKNKIGQVQVMEIAGFYESAVISDRVVFAVDASLSMKGAQIESLKQTLNQVVDSFPQGVKFNIVDFGGHVRTLAPGGMIPSNNRKQAMRQFAYEMKLTLGTRTYDAIERAMQIPGMDSVHFLSDGAPYGSHLKDWRRIDYATRLRCRVAPVAVHMIYFPEKGKANPNAHFVKLMKLYAEDNAGRFNVSSAEPAAD